MLVSGTCLAAGLGAGLWFQYSDAWITLEITAVSDHDDRFQFYWQHEGEKRWNPDQWPRPVRKGVPTKLFLKFRKDRLKRFKIEPLREPGIVRFTSIRVADRFDLAFRPFPAERLTARRDIERLPDEADGTAVFRVPEGAEDPQIYVEDVAEFQLSAADFFNRRLPGRVARSALAMALLLIPLVMMALETTKKGTADDR
jgi:hypothetical protein